MKMFNTIILAGSALLLSASSLAQITTFEAGTPASASEMNANFATVVEAIEGLESRITDIEDDADDNDVTNRIYRVFAFHNKIEQQLDAGGENATFLDIVSAGSFFMSFDAESAGQVIVSGVHQEREQQTGWFLAGEDPDFFESPTPPFMPNSVTEVYTNAGLGPLLLPYSQDGVGIVTITGIEAEFRLSADGGVLIGGTRRSLDDSFEGGLYIGVEVFPFGQ